MRKLIFPFLVLILAFAFFTKPTDKACIIGGVKAVWGKMVPDEKTLPGYFEDFMDISSDGVEVNDWIFFKVVNYQLRKEQKTVAIGAFGNVFALVKPYQTNDYIPSMPTESKQ